MRPRCSLLVARRLSHSVLRSPTLLYGVVNLIPVSPFDGDVILSGWLWRRTGSPARAATIAARVNMNVAGGVAFVALWYQSVYLACCRGRLLLRCGRCTVRVTGCCCGPGHVRGARITGSCVEILS